MNVKGENRLPHGSGEFVGNKRLRDDELTLEFLPPPPPLKKFKCSQCGVNGHNRTMCPQTPCSKCGLIGHRLKNCPDEIKAMKEMHLDCFACNGNLKKFIKLHKSGVSLKGRVGKMTPLMYASISRCDGMFDYIFKHIATEGIDVNAKEKTSGRTALHIACDNGEHISASKLIDAGADINARDIYGFTPLMIAVLDNDPKVVKLLIERGVDQNIVRNRDVTYEQEGTALQMAQKMHKSRVLGAFN